MVGSPEMQQRKGGLACLGRDSRRRTPHAKGSPIGLLVKSINHEMTYEQRRRYQTEARPSKPHWQLPTPRARPRNAADAVPQEQRVRAAHQAVTHAARRSAWNR